MSCYNPLLRATCYQFLVKFRRYSFNPTNKCAYTVIAVATPAKTEYDLTERITFLQFRQYATESGSNVDINVWLTGKPVELGKFLGAYKSTSHSKLEL